jgi:hypothetical protein
LKRMDGLENEKEEGRKLKRTEAYEHIRAPLMGFLWVEAMESWPSARVGWQTSTVESRDGSDRWRREERQGMGTHEVHVREAYDLGEEKGKEREARETHNCRS